MRRTLLLIPLFVLAGCAGNPQTPNVATAGGATPTASSSAAGGGQDGGDQVKFAKCMRENGLPDFPDPDTTDPHRFSIMIPEGTPKATVDKAMAACKAFMPNGGERRKADPAITAQLRKLSQCMRENGLPDFPDPSADGGIEIKNEGGKGIDPESAEFKKAEETCKQFRPSPPPGSGGEQKSNSSAGG